MLLLLVFVSQCQIRFWVGEKSMLFSLYDSSQWRCWWRWWWWLRCVCSTWHFLVCPLSRRGCCCCCCCYAFCLLLVVDTGASARSLRLAFSCGHLALFILRLSGVMFSCPLSKVNIPTLFFIQLGTLCYKMVETVKHTFVSCFCSKDFFRH